MKPFSEIIIKSTKSWTGGHMAGDRIQEQMSLSEKIESYSLKLGKRTTHTLGFVIQLLSGGKVRLDFRDFHERLELMDPSDLVSRSEALHATEAYLSGLQSDHDSQHGTDLTQKIIIQAPRR